MFLRIETVTGCVDEEGSQYQAADKFILVNLSEISAVDIGHDEGIIFVYVNKKRHFKIFVTDSTGYMSNEIYSVFMNIELHDPDGDTEIELAVTKEEYFRIKDTLLGLST